MGLKPVFRLVADSQDVTDRLAARFMGLRLTDETGADADSLEITLADPADSPIPIPRTGAELELWLGYDNQAQRMGLFVVDEIELNGWPGDMVIRARAAPYEATNGGKKWLQTQKSRSWPKGTKLSAMVEKIAKDNGLKPAVSPALQAVGLPHLDQTEESDLSFLIRVCKKYDALVKPGGGALVVLKRGEGKTASGQDMTPIAVAASDCGSFRLTLARRDSPGTVVAHWHATKAARRQEIKVGSGEPVKVLRTPYTSAEDATAAASAELDRRRRGTGRLALTMPGNPEVTAERLLNLAGFRDGVNGEWIVTRVTHSLDKSRGYACEVEAEKPNGGGED
jgi:hypothetical protein